MLLPKCFYWMVVAQFYNIPSEAIHATRMHCGLVQSRDTVGNVSIKETSALKQRLSKYNILKTVVCNIIILIIFFYLLS